MTRLRPGVRATAMPRGVHVRGWTGSFTVEGGEGVPALWTRLEDALRQDRLDDLLAAAGPKARKVLLDLLETLDGHDMLAFAPSTEKTPDDGDRPTPCLSEAWFDAVAADPEAAQRAVRNATFTVHASGDSADPLAESVRRALTRLGAVDVNVRSSDDDEPAGQVVLDAAGHAVALRVCGGSAFVTEPIAPDLVRADAHALTDRLGLAPPAPQTLTDRVGFSPRPLAALVAGAAAQRLVCAVAGLPDPATYGENPRLPEGWPSVLVASADPLHAEYHPWRGRPVAAPTTLADALRTVEALCDGRTGLLPAAYPGSLPQLPAALAACDVPGGTLVAIAARVDLARVEATCRAAELFIAEPMNVPVAVGMNHDHALGRALRTLALALPLDDAELVATDEWMSDRHAHHWWQSLTTRLGVGAQPLVYQLADGVFRAEVRSDGHVMGRAIEATPADAMVFAALTATGLAQTPSDFREPRHHVAPSGAIASLAVAGAAVAPWEGLGSTVVWLGGVADRQAGLRDQLVRLVGPVRPWRPQQAQPLWDAGLTVLVPGGDA